MTWYYRCVDRRSTPLRGVVLRGALALGLSSQGAWALADEPVEPVGEPAVVGDLTESSVLVADESTPEPTPAAEPKPAVSTEPTPAERPAQQTTAEASQQSPADEKQADLAPEATEPRVASRATPKASSSAAAEEAPESGTTISVSRFQGMTPGVSTRAELLEEWGDPEESSPTKTGDLLLYRMPPFDAVEVLIEDDVVALVKVQLDQQQQAAKLAKRLQLESVRAVEIRDDATRASIARAYPEKGILFLLSDANDSSVTPLQFVTHMIIQPLGAEAFALRADQAEHAAFELRLADLQQAIKIEPTNAYAHWRLAQLHLLTGSPDTAGEAATAALKAEPDSDAYRLCWARCLADQGRYDQAVLEARKVLDSQTEPSVIKAGALHLMGSLASKGEASIADKAIGFHTLAVETADQLATTPDQIERVAAKRLLVDAHLAIARQIARRKYDRKPEVVGQWVGRASGIAEQMIESGEADLELRLIVAREALAALAEIKPPKDPQPWIEEAENAASELLADSNDPLFRSRVEWQLGEAYFHALRIEHSRKEPESGLGHANRAISRLSSSAVTGEVRPDAELLVGRLYFHIGAMHAVHKNDHAKAVEWYAKAQPLLSDAVEESEFVVPRRRGEALVSMAVSYWEQGQRDQAMTLTLRGADYMKRAVASGVLNKKALAVPYGNLATMHERLGNAEESARFARLASSAREDGATVAKATVKPASTPRRSSTQQANRQRRRQAQ